MKVICPNCGEHIPLHGIDYKGPKVETLEEMKRRKLREFKEAANSGGTPQDQKTS